MEDQNTIIISMDAIINNPYSDVSVQSHVVYWGVSTEDFNDYSQEVVINKEIKGKLKGKKVKV